MNEHAEAAAVEDNGTGVGAATERAGLPAH